MKGGGAGGRPASVVHRHVDGGTTGSHTLLIIVKIPQKKKHKWDQNLIF
jgi:hypothetical protein